MWQFFSHWRERGKRDRHALADGRDEYSSRPRGHLIPRRRSPPAGGRAASAPHDPGRPTIRYRDLLPQICSEIGLSINAALNIFVRKVVREHRIPFELSDDPFYSESNMRHLRASIADAKAGRVFEHDLIED